MKRFVAVIGLSLAALAAHSAEDIYRANGQQIVEAGRTVGNVKTTNGQLRLKENVTARDVTTTNGSLSIGERSQVERVKSVNGKISLADGVRAQGVESTNGTIEIGKQAQIARGISVTNGAVSIDQGSTVGGDIHTTNGRISLQKTRVEGQLSTSNGDIHVGADSHIGKGIVIKKSMFGLFNNNRRPEVVIGPNAVVEGTLTFERDVNLHVSESARIGTVRGATPTRFKGERP